MLALSLLREYQQTEQGRASRAGRERTRSLPGRVEAPGSRSLSLVGRQADSRNTGVPGPRETRRKSGRDRGAPCDREKPARFTVEKGLCGLRFVAPY